jgi:hypothetical protein
MTNLDPRPGLEVLDGGQPCTAVEVLEPRLVPLGGVRATTVHRTLPQRFVGRDHDEIVEFRRRYQAELGFEPADPRDEGKSALFGTFPPDQPPPLPAPPLPNTRLLPREQ